MHDMSRRLRGGRWHRRCQGDSFRSDHHQEIAHRAQTCRHRFCRECLAGYIAYKSEDISCLYHRLTYITREKDRVSLAQNVMDIKLTLKGDANIWSQWVRHSMSWTFVQSCDGRRWDVPCCIKHNNQEVHTVRTEFIIFIFVLSFLCVWRNVYVLK